MTGHRAMRGCPGVLVSVSRTNSTLLNTNIGNVSRNKMWDMRMKSRKTIRGCIDKWLRDLSQISYPPGSTKGCGAGCGAACNVSLVAATFDIT